MDNVIFITGATSGFGRAVAEKFSANKWNCIITGRRKEQLDMVAKHLRDSYNVAVLPLCFDVRNRQEVNQTISNLPKEWTAVNILVNNAGLALGLDHFQDADVDNWDTMIDTNIKGLLYVSKAVVPMMIARKKGHIINVGSTAAKDAYEKGNVYCATKAAVDSISKAMRIDLLQHSIKVTAVHPGAAATEFSLVRFKGDKETAKNVYAGYQPLVAQDVADVIFYCATLPPHVCINDLVVTPLAQANAFYSWKQ